MSNARLPEPTCYITGHELPSGNSVVFPPKPLNWGSFDDGNMPMAVAYINKFPADLNHDADLKYNEKMNKDKVGLVSGGGAVLRYVDLAPGYECMMHRTQSLDYGIALYGRPECVMDTGEVQSMKPGDVMVQRYTKHSWRNPSKTEWARVVFVLMDCLPLSIDGQTLKEDLGRGAAYVPSSDNE